MKSFNESAITLFARILLLHEFNSFVWSLITLLLLLNPLMENSERFQEREECHWYV